MSETNETKEVVKKKKWLVPVIIAGVVALIAIAVITAIVILTVAAPKRALKNQLDAGQKYLTELDYEKAILAYEEALRIDPKNTEAYLGLAEAFVGTGDYDAALKVLDKGFEQTNSEAIQDKRVEVEQIIQETKEAEEDTSEELAEEEDTPGYTVDEEGWAVFSEGKVLIKIRGDEYIISLETKGIDDVYYCDEPELELNSSYYFWVVMFTDGIYDYRIGTIAWKFDGEPYETSIYDMDSSMDITILATSEGYRSTTPEVTVEGNKLIYSGRFEPKRDFEKLPEGFSGVNLENLKIKRYTIRDSKGYDSADY